MESSLYVMSISASSDWVYSCVIFRNKLACVLNKFKTIGHMKMIFTGSNSVVGGASMKDCRIGRLKFVDAQRMKRFKSILEISPIGLMSADEQSHFVK